MLGDKNRMTAKRGLFAVVHNHRWSKALGDEILGMGEHHRQAFAVEVSKVLAPQVKATAKGGFGQRSKNVIQVSHTN